MPGAARSCQEQTGLAGSYEKLTENQVLLGATKSMEKLGVEKEFRFVRIYYVETHFLSQLRQGTPDAPNLQDFGTAARSWNCQEMPRAARS